MAKLNYSIEFRNGTNTFAPPREQYLEIRINGNNIGTPKVRFYEKGTTPPAYDAMTHPSYYLKTYGGFAAGKTYQVDYKDSALDTKLFEIDVYNNNPGPYLGNIDYNFAQEIINISASNGALTIFYNVTGNSGFPNTIALGGNPYRGTFYDLRYGGDRYRAYWSASELSSLGYGNQIPILNFKTTYGGYGTTSKATVKEWNFLQPSYPPLLSSYGVTNISANGANDGSIGIGVSGGSGSYSFLWADGPTTQNRFGLGPGLYSVVITDTITGHTTAQNNIEVTEPQPPDPLPVIGSILESVPANPLLFVPETLDAGTPQTLDNTLFCKQVHKGYQMGRYYNPYQKSDPLIFQFNGDFTNYLLELINKTTGETVTTYPLTLKQENLGVANDYAIRIQNDTTPGKSRVYSQTSNIVLLTQLNVGDIFEIVNNLDGFNGAYAVVDIGDDYYVITKNYAIVPAYSNGTGRFISSSQDYNVYEAVIDLLAVANGKYYFKLTGISDNTKSIVSEPIDVRVTHPATVGISYRNIDNSFGTIWTTGFTGFIRVPASFFKRLPGGERSIIRSADFKLVKINAKKKRIIALEIFYVTPYIIELLSLVFDCDYFAIDGVEFQAEEGIGEPEYTDRFYLANVVTNVEQVNWVSGYNGNDVGTISDGGFLKTEQGFLKR